MKRIWCVCAILVSVSVGAAEKAALDLAAQATASVTNLIGLSLQEATAVLEGQSKAERKDAEDRMRAQLDEARKLVKEQGRGLDLRSLEAGASKIRELERGLKKELKRLKKKHQARLDALR